MDELFVQYDELVDSLKFQEAFALIENALMDDNFKSPEVYWRMARVCREIGIFIIIFLSQL